MSCRLVTKGHGEAATGWLFGTSEHCAWSNAGSDTAFRVALGGHQLTVTHSDEFPMTPVTTDTVLIGTGQRYDVSFTVGDGMFPLVALAENKEGATTCCHNTHHAETGMMTSLSYQS